MTEKEWLKQNRYYSSINEQRLKSIFYFTLIWNIFEKECCGKYAKIGVHPESLATKLHNDIDVDLINNIYNYFQNRYVIDGTPNKLFRDFDFGGDGLHYKNFVQEKLLNKESSTKEKLQALLYIAFRLRNNLYHGIKEVEKLYDQNENFKQINLLLMEIIDK